MRKILLFAFIVIFAIISRFLFIGKMPPLIDASLIFSRYVSAVLSVGSILLCYILIKHSFKRIKLALLSAFLMAVLPWTIEQGRIFSQVNNALFFCLLIIFFLEKINRRFYKIVLLLLIPAGLYFIYPQFWLFRLSQKMPNLADLLNNIFVLFSPDMLFFHNITFWWGGIKEFGIIYLSLSPFFLYGFYRLINSGRYKLFFLLVFILLISSLSPFFPESREFFFSVPILSFATAYGIIDSFDRNKKRKLVKLLIVFSLIFFFYEISQYFHYYTVHYGQEIIKNQSQIYEAF